MTTKRTHKHERLARIYDEEILPIWSHRFGRMLLRGLTLPERGTVLDVCCGTGYPALEILRKMGSGSRLIAIDASSSMLDAARKKAEEMGRKGIYFRTESAFPKLSFANDVYDLVVCNLGLTEAPDPGQAVAEFARVTKPGGELRCSVPLAGTFEEFYDIYREVLIKHDKQDVLERLGEHLRLYPPPETCERWLRDAGLIDVEVKLEEFELLFKSSREFFFAPVIEFGPLPGWKAVAGRGQELQDVFWYIKEAIDAYFAGRPFHLTVKAGCLTGRKPEPGEADVTGPRERIEKEEIVDIELGTAELDVSDLEDTLGGDDDIEIEAFIEGKPRPPHLDDA